MKTKLAPTSAITAPTAKAPTLRLSPASGASSTLPRQSARAVTEKTLLVNGEQIAFDETDCVLTLEKVQQTFDNEAIEIDGHTLATTEHHMSEHPHHDHDPYSPRTDAG